MFDEIIEQNQQTIENTLCELIRFKSVSEETEVYARNVNTLCA